MAENKASTAAAAAALRGRSHSKSSFSAAESRKLSLFPATPNRSIPTSRASSIRGFGTPTRAHELRSIQEDDDTSTTTSAMPLRPTALYRRHSSITARRPTFGMARSPSMHLERRGSQSYLRRTQSMYTGGARSVYREMPFRMEENPAFLPASSRPGSMLQTPMLRTLRDPDALGTKRATGYARRFPISLRMNIFGKARTLGRRMSRSLGWSRPSLPQMPVQQVHAEIKHYGSPERASTGYFDIPLEDTSAQSQYADTVIHHRFWENQSYVTTLDNQGSEYTHSSAPDAQSVTTSAPIRMSVAEPSKEPTDRHGVDPRRVYSALMKGLSKRFSSEAPLPDAIAEEPEEPRPSRASNENVRPVGLLGEKGTENRRPLLEIPGRSANTLIIEEEDEDEVSEQQSQQQTPTAGAVKRIRSDDALFSQIAHPHHVWQEEETADTTTADAALAALKNLNISNFASVTDEAAVTAEHYPKMVPLPPDGPVTTTPELPRLGATTREFRTASGKVYEVKLKSENNGEEEEMKALREAGLDPAFL
ncbi:hypothetical protein Dda_4893 [Drechslerella dactyloides]|uniref:Uncharacterized protein n=1 Tax=Drechslerella dactyloides TaxID=74499 RepID=A0AAD6NIC8_DREDA|nr:hypothetical protein Dda_4893 [Drechslerella dactyloides]